VLLDDGRRLPYRVLVGPDLAVPGYGKRIFAIGDIALLDGDDGKPLPALAQVAKQQGQFLGKALAGAIRGDAVPNFRFRNRGNTAIIGWNAAICDFSSGVPGADDAGGWRPIGNPFRGFAQIRLRTVGPALPDRQISPKFGDD
jgi:NADH dehydrogenase FAD-containing subunit